MAEYESPQYKEKGKYKHAVRALRMAGLKPSDFFLFKEISSHFFTGLGPFYALRATCVLGLRVIYSLWHDPVCRERIIALAQQMSMEDLNEQDYTVTYTAFLKIPQG